MTKAREHLPSSLERMSFFLLINRVQTSNTYVLNKCYLKMVAFVELNSCAWLTKGSLYSILFNVTSDQLPIFPMKETFHDLNRF